ncbi:hypothetical protein ACHQM5_013360 [Ranunculus cassubicifolius]
MEKLKSLIPNTLTQTISQSTPLTLPSTCSSLLNFFQSQQLFHQILKQLTDPHNSLCTKNTETALNLKIDGNDCFTNRDYQKALNLYTQALRFAPIEYGNEAERDLVSKIYVNRASTLHNMGFWVECVRDCDRAIILSPSYAKAWYRRGKANASLESFEDAINDLNTAMSLENSPLGKSRIKNEIDIILNRSQNASNTSTKCGEKSVRSLVQPRLIDLKCVSTPAKGRGMTSESDIPQASLIHTEEPFVAILLKHNRDTHCHFCFDELPKDAVPCSSCSIPLYCSENCQVQAGGEKRGNINSRSLDVNLSNDINKIVSSLSLASNHELADGDSNGVIHEHEHECGGAHWPAVLPSEIILAGRILVKLKEKMKQSRGAMKPIDALELAHNYAQMSVESKVELHIYSIVLTYCLHHTSTVELPLDGDSASQLVILVSQIRVNSMAVVHMKSQDSYWAQKRHGKISSHEDSLTSDIEQVKVGQAIYLTASLFNHSCQPNIHAYFLSRTLYIQSTENIIAGFPLELSYGPQVGQWGLLERQQMLDDRYAFKCQCTGCSEINFSDLVVNAFSCSNPDCSGVVMDHFINLDNKMKREEINEVAHILFEKQDGSSHIDSTHCLNCGLYRDLELLRLKSKKAQSCIKRLKDTYLCGEIPPEVLSEALKAIHLLRSTLHAYNKDLAQAEDSLAEAFCFTGDFQKAMHHCKASLQILERLYNPKHIVIGNELVKLASIQLSLGDGPNAIESVNQADTIFGLYYGSDHVPRICPYLECLKNQAKKVCEMSGNY